MKKTKKYQLYLINITITLGLFFFICFYNKLYPFTKNTFGISDGLAQFRPMLFDVITKLKHGILGPYSFNNGLGNPTIFNILYYVSSPLNIFALLFTRPEKMYFSVLVIKIIITSICVTKYGLHKTDNKLENKN